jgi:hypothetical protein
MGTSDHRLPMGDPMEGRLHAWFQAEVQRAERDIRVAGTRPRRDLQAVRRTARSRIATPTPVMLVLLATFAVAVLRLAPGRSTNSAPFSVGGSQPSPGGVTVTSSYADGVPRIINGEQVYRPEDIPTSPSSPILVGGWDSGPLFVSCPDETSGQAIACPAYEGLGERATGPKVLNVRWDGPYPGTAPAVVIRAQVDKPFYCKSTPPGNCPVHPDLHALSLVWQGSPD